MVLEREAKNINWRDCFHQLESKVYSQVNTWLYLINEIINIKTQDKYTQLTTDVATTRYNSDLNRYQHVL